MQGIGYRVVGASNSGQVEGLYLSMWPYGSAWVWRGNYNIDVYEDDNNEVNNINRRIYVKQ